MLERFEDCFWVFFWLRWILAQIAKNPTVEKLKPDQQSSSDEFQKMDFIVHLNSNMSKCRHLIDIAR